MDQTETKSLLDRLRDPAAWEEFLAYKNEGGHLSKREEADLARFVSDREYEAVADRILSGESLSSPRKSAIAKKGTDKKRIVYIFPREEKWALKLITYCLREYDGIFSQNLYSFRVGQGAKKAVARMLHGRRIEESCDTMPVILLEAALLIEGKLDEICDEVWFVSAPKPVQIRRLMENRGYSRKKAESIIARQLSYRDFLRHSDHVIHNGSDFSKTTAEIDRLMKGIYATICDSEV